MQAGLYPPPSPGRQAQGAGQRAHLDVAAERSPSLAGPSAGEVARCRRGSLELLPTPWALSSAWVCVGRSQRQGSLHGKHLLLDGALPIPQLVDARTDQEAPPPFGVHVPGRTRGSGRSPGALLLSRELLVTPSGQYSQCTLSRFPKLLPWICPPRSKDTPALSLRLLTFSLSPSPMRALWGSHPHIHSHTLSRFIPPTHHDKAMWGPRQGEGSLRTSRQEVFFQCLPGPTPALQPHPIPRGTLISQTTLGGEA